MHTQVTNRRADFSGLADEDRCRREHGDTVRCT
jgi:hypothetical protein